MEAIGSSSLQDFTNLQQKLETSLRQSEQILSKFEQDLSSAYSKLVDVQFSHSAVSNDSYLTLTSLVQPIREQRFSIQAKLRTLQLERDRDLIQQADLAKRALEHQIQAEIKSYAPQSFVYQTPAPKSAQNYPTSTGLRASPVLERKALQVIRNYLSKQLSRFQSACSVHDDRMSNREIHTSIILKLEKDIQNVDQEIRRVDGMIPNVLLQNSSIAPQSSTITAAPMLSAAVRAPPFSASLQPLSLESQFYRKDEKSVPQDKHDDEDEAPAVFSPLNAVQRASLAPIISIVSPSSYASSSSSSSSIEDCPESDVSDDPLLMKLMHNSQTHSASASAQKQSQVTPPASPSITPRSLPPPSPVVPSHSHLLPSVLAPSSPVPSIVIQRLQQQQQPQIVSTPQKKNPSPSPSRLRMSSLDTELYQSVLFKQHNQHNQPSSITMMTPTRISASSMMMHPSAPSPIGPPPTIVNMVSNPLLAPYQYPHQSHNNNNNHISSLDHEQQQMQGRQQQQQQEEEFVKQPQLDETDEECLLLESSFDSPITSVALMPTKFSSAQKSRLNLSLEDNQKSPSQAASSPFLAQNAVNKAVTPRASLSHLISTRISTTLEGLSMALNFASEGGNPPVSAAIAAPASPTTPVALNLVQPESPISDAQKKDTLLPLLAKFMEEKGSLLSPPHSSSFAASNSHVLLSSDQSEPHQQQQQSPVQPLDQQAKRQALSSAASRLNSQPGPASSSSSPSVASPKAPTMGVRSSLEMMKAAARQKKQMGPIGAKSPLAVNDSDKQLLSPSPSPAPVMHLRPPQSPSTMKSPVVTGKTLSRMTPVLTASPGSRSLISSKQMQ